MVFGQKGSSIELLLIVEDSKANYLKEFFNFSHLLIKGLISLLAIFQRFDKVNLALNFC